MKIKVKILLFVLLCFLIIFCLVFPTYNYAAPPVVGVQWGCYPECQRDYYKARNTWFISHPDACNIPVGVSGKYNVDYQIFVHGSQWDHNTDTYYAALPALKTWVEANYATYGYSTSAEALEDCFVHLKTGESPVTITPVQGGSITVTAYDPNNPKASRIPGGWQNPSGPSEWMMNLHATIYLDYWRLAKFSNYAYDGVYLDGTSMDPVFPSVASGGALTYARTKEFANDSYSTYMEMMSNFLAGLKTTLNNQGKLLGGNLFGAVFNTSPYKTYCPYPSTDCTYPYKDQLDFMIREMRPGWIEPAEIWLTEIAIAKNASISNPSFKQLYNPQFLLYDDRAKMTVLAAYYTIQNASSAMIPTCDVQTGNSFWADAWTYDIGNALGDTYIFTSGNDGWEGCSDGITWIALGRQFSNALVLYRGTVWGPGVPPGTCWDKDEKTAKTISLGGTYRPLNANGTLGSPVSSISLKGWEGAVLIPVGGNPDTTAPRPPSDVKIR